MAKIFTSAAAKKKAAMRSDLHGNVVAAVRTAKPNVICRVKRPVKMPWDTFVETARSAIHTTAGTGNYVTRRDVTADCLQVVIMEPGFTR